MGTNTTELVYAGDPSSWMIPKDFANDKDLMRSYNITAQAGHIWNAQTLGETPKQFIEKRVVGKEDGEDIWADYIKQFYIIRELNRLFPGWELLDFKVWFQPEVLCWVGTGVLHVRYYDIVENEYMWRHIPGAGGAEVKEKANKKGKAFGADQLIKGVRTDLIKNCSYWLGIAFDVYSREVPMSMRSKFEDYVRDWQNKDYILGIAETINNRDKFVQFLNNLPQPKHTARFMRLLTKLVNPSIEPELWNNFIRQNIKSIVGWLDGLEESTQIKKES